MKDPEVLSDWLSGNGVGKDDGGAPWCKTNPKVNPEVLRLILRLTV